MVRVGTVMGSQAPWVFPTSDFLRWHARAHSSSTLLPALAASRQPSNFSAKLVNWLRACSRHIRLIDFVLRREQ